MIRGLMITVGRVFSGDMTLKQAYIFSKMRLFNTQKGLNDDFDWTQYHLHYREELKVTGRTSTILPKPGDFNFIDGTLTQVDERIKPLHPNHHLLYEVILRLGPRRVLEIGCGGGDHLRNLHLFNPSFELFGVDRSEQQMQTLRQRHPSLSAVLEVHDVTQPEAVLPAADVGFTQTVLMHISETQGRLQNALATIFTAVESQVVMVEDWSEHDFLAHVKEAIARDPAWAHAKIYFTHRPSQPATRALIISKTPLPYPELEDYDDLLQGRKMQIH